MTDSIKILPAVMIASLLLLSLKVPGLWSQIEAEIAGVSSAQAASDTVTSAGVEPAGNQMPIETAALSETGSTEFPNVDNSSFGRRPVLTAPGLMTEAEIEVLQSLASRRDTLESLERELELREKMLLATEQRVVGKIDDLKAIEQHIEEMLVLRDEEEEEQLASLVKVYKTMKAKDAARIFELLDTDILLDVSARMKEQKMAAIMAQMDADAAQELTEMLATRLELPALNEGGAPQGKIREKS